MKRKITLPMIVITIFAFFPLKTLYSGDRSVSITEDIKYNPGNKYRFEITDKVPEYTPAPVYKGIKTNKVLDGESKEWVLKDSVYFDEYIPAGRNYGVTYNRETNEFEQLSPYTYTDEALAAIEKAPVWIRPKLKNTLGRLSALKQNTFAAIINDAVDPYVDEIAFTLAYSSPAYLGSKRCYAQLFTENAQLIYENDKILQYVEVVDSGSSKTGNDYYSTVRYRKIDKDGNPVYIQVPKEIYYMYIVFPKLSDEIQTYIDPGKYEHDANYQNHIYNIAAPPLGVIWRDFLFRYTEANPDAGGENYPILKDEIAKCDILWNDAAPEEPGAIRVMTKWINDVMNFTSENERPHQPVRIYKLHIGRCGEHEDLTNAVSRTCLVPCRGINRISTDHVWNEFWDNGWEQWEPVNNWFRNKNAEGNVNLGTCFARRSDGVLEFVTKDYLKGNPASTFNIFVTDKENKPIDGATVVLYVKQTDGDGFMFDSYQTTGNDGKCQFIVGTQRTYAAKVMTPIGNYPPDEGYVASLKDNPAGDQVYNFTTKIAAAKPVAHNTQTDPPVPETNNYKLKSEFNVVCSAINNNLLLNDMTGEYTTYEIPGGRISFYVTDEENQGYSSQNNNFTSVLSTENVQMTETPVRFEYPDEGNWCAFLRNGENLRNIVYARGYFALYAYEIVGVDDAEKESSTGNITQSYCYPNPAVSETAIKYTLKNPGKVKIEIYDANGFLVNSLMNKYMEPGSHVIMWNGTGINNIPLPSGIYFFRITSGGDIKTAKISYIRG